MKVLRLDFVDYLMIVFAHFGLILYYGLRLVVSFVVLGIFVTLVIFDY